MYMYLRPLQRELIRRSFDVDLLRTISDLCKILSFHNF